MAIKRVYNYTVDKELVSGCLHMSLLHALSSQANSISLVPLPRRQFMLLGADNARQIPVIRILRAR